MGHGQDLLQLVVVKGIVMDITCDVVKLRAGDPLVVTIIVDDLFKIEGINKFNKSKNKIPYVENHFLFLGSVVAFKIRFVKNAEKIGSEFF